MDEFEKKAHDAGLHFKSYPKTKMINVTDKFGVVQSYYTSTGTAILRDSNNKFNQQRKTLWDMDYGAFLELCNNPDDILDNYFLEEE